MIIDSWEAYLDAWFEEDEKGVLGANRDLRPMMTSRFRCYYDRIVRRIVAENSVYAYSRPYVEVTARKHRARKRRKRK